jgi:hypothetical protein
MGGAFLGPGDLVLELGEHHVRQPDPPGFGQLVGQGLIEHGQVLVLVGAVQQAVLGHSGPHLDHELLQKGALEPATGLAKLFLLGVSGVEGPGQGIHPQLVLHIDAGLGLRGQHRGIKPHGHVR